MTDTPKKAPFPNVLETVLFMFERWREENRRNHLKKGREYDMILQVKMYGWEGVP